MAIDKKLIHFKTWNKFIEQIGGEANITTPTSGKEEDGTALYGQIKGTSIVFIKDVGKIWTHGNLYGENEIVIDDVLSDTSENPVKGNVIKEYVDLHPQYESVDEIDVPEIDLPMVECDSELSTTSIKPVQNRVVTQALNNKVDKVSGKQLSTEDFTTSLKNKLVGLKEFDPTEINNEIDVLAKQVNTKQNKLVSGTSIKTINGESILGNGDLQIESAENIYITEFTINDLFNVSDTGESLPIDSDSILNAVNENKIIIVPHNKDYTGGGFIANIENSEKWVNFYINNNFTTILFWVYKTEPNDEITSEEVMISYWQDALVSGENIRTINGEEIIGDGSNMELATKDEINAKADDSSVVHKTIDETITGTKTFRGRVKFLHSGDNSVVFGADTRIGVDGTNDNVLGFIHGSFVVNNSNYPLYLYSQTTRPIYNNTEELALLSDVNGKQDVITDLASIREGASKGATALQSIPSEYVTENELTAKGYATTSALNDKVDKVSGKQLSTEDFTSALKAKLEGLSNYDDTTLANAISGLETRLNTLVSGDASTAIESFNEIIAFLDGVQDTQDLASIIASIEQQIAGKMDKVTLAAVATSGSYNDLSNKPTIPAAVTESTVSGWGFTKNTGTYSKPSGGIPKTDLASAVQTSLGKADTALQSYTEQYKGTVTGVKINGTTKNPSNGVVDLGTVITSHQDISGKQDTLVSGTNIKTVQGQSILGSGNISISVPTVDAALSSTSTNAVQNKVVKAELDKKQDGISDLEAIRRGAAKGETAVQPESLSDYYTKFETDRKVESGYSHSVFEENVGTYKGFRHNFDCKAGGKIVNRGIKFTAATDANLTNRQDIPTGSVVILASDKTYLQTLNESGTVDFDYISPNDIALEASAEQVMVHVDKNSEMLKDITQEREVQYGSTPELSFNVGFIDVTGKLWETGSYANYRYTNHIEVQEGDTVLFPQKADGTYLTLRVMTVYNGDVVNSAISQNSYNKGSLLVPEGVTSIVITTEASIVDSLTVKVIKDINITEIKPSAQVECLLNKCAKLEGAVESLAANTSLVLSQGLNLKKGCKYIISFKFEGGVANNALFSVGSSDAGYTSSRIDVTPSDIIIYNSGIESKSIEHGLTIKDFLHIEINVANDSCNANASFRLLTNGGEFIKEANNTTYFPNSYGNISFQSNISVQDVKYIYIASDLLTDIIVFGDSYIGLSSDRWPGKMMQRGYYNFALSGFSGSQSSNAIKAFREISKVRMPKYVVWALGMNDGDSASAINSSWFEYVKEVRSWCSLNDRTLILCTTPNVPSINHTYKNDYVRQSGLRYIDFAKAVNAENAGATWYEGMLYSDNVHPSSTGAAALCARVLLDLPEITL